MICVLMLLEHVLGKTRYLNRGSRLKKSNGPDPSDPGKRRVR